MYDHINLIVMDTDHGEGATGAIIKDHVRAVAQGGGDKVESAVAGLKLIAAGKKVDYAGASGPCDFTDVGDITDSKFLYQQVKAGKLVNLKVA